MNTDIQGDFEICISVPLIFEIDFFLFSIFLEFSLLELFLMLLHFRIQKPFSFRLTRKPYPKFQNSIKYLR